MDMPLNLRHTLSIVALTQSLVAALSEDIDHGAYQFDCHPMIAKQNKWHATRFGLEAQFINPTTLKAITAREAVIDLIDSCRPMAERLRCADYLTNLNDILEKGTGAERQRNVFLKTNSTLEVARFLADASSEISSASSVR